MNLKKKKNFDHRLNDWISSCWNLNCSWCWWQLKCFYSNVKCFILYEKQFRLHEQTQQQQQQKCVVVKQDENSIGYVKSRIISFFLFNFYSSLWFSMVFNNTNEKFFTFEKKKKIALFVFQIVVANHFKQFSIETISCELSCLE